MTTSIVSIYNLALQKLGAARVASTDEDSRNARSCTACYEHLRDLELRQRAWKFAIKRASLAVSATAPIALIDLNFPSQKAYPLPVDCLRVLFPPRTFNDWTIEQIDGSPAIITNDGAPLGIRYIARVTDPTQFDENFVDMVACKMALYMCEEITQSTTKAQAVAAMYENARNLARQMNAYEKLPTNAAEDSWSTARRSGATQAPWLSRQNG